MSSRLGVHKLVLLNSGGFRFAEFDVARPVHFAADNNGGKSTLVNALQFLMVDEFDKMVFGDHDLASTRHHYFGQAPSYIVFECMTRSGPQCLVVAGSGDITGSKFTRYVYRGVFDASHYRDEEGRLADLASLKKNLVTCDVLEVKHSRLWRVLCRPSDMRGDDNESARLGILALKRVEDYHSFREVFIKLLGLSKAQADELKRLLIACSCQSVRATSVDVKKEYNEQFARLERDDTELAWLKAVGHAIDRGVSLRATLSELDCQLSEAAMAARGESRRCIGIERTLTLAVQAERSRLSTARSDCRSKQATLNQEIGSLRATIQRVEEQLGTLEDDHRKWSQITDLQLSGWRSQREAFEHAFHDTELRLKETARQDFPALERRLEGKRRELEGRTREFHDWESRTSGYLEGLGFSPTQLGTLFTMVNPALALASHRQVLGDADPKAVKALVARTLLAVRGDVFTMEGVSIHLASVAAPKDAVTESRERAQERVLDAENELEHLARLVEVARDVEATRDKQRGIRAELDALSQKLRDHAAYLKSYLERPRLTSEVQAFHERLSTMREQAKTLDADEQVLGVRMDELRSTDGDLKRAHDLRSSISSQLSQVEIGHLHQDGEHTPPKDRYADADPSELVVELREAMRQLEASAKRLAELQRLRATAAGEIATVQGYIASESRKRGARMAVFDQDVEQEWAELANLRSSVGENEQRLQTLWEALFKSLAAELDLLRRSVAEVKKRATRINSDLRRYKVSNLESVEVHIDHDTREYAIIEKMTSQDSMFLNARDVADAKRELQQWITDGKTIELRDIFTVRIRIQNQGELRPVDVPSIDEIGSQGTGMTAKVMIYLQLLRSIIDDEKSEFRMHFYLDEIGKLDDRNLHATTEMAVRRGFVPITAEPEPRAESLAHPEVLIYHLGKSGKHFEIVDRLTYRARAKTKAERVPV